MRRTRGTVASLLGVMAVIATAGCSSVRQANDATNFRTRLQTVDPGPAAVDVEIVENGYRMQVTNHSDEEVVVLGYQDEPYLRIRRDGVAENLRSPATYINRDRQGTTSVPGIADPEADPRWSRVDDGNVARWHDHRIHWMGGSNPAAVQMDPGRRHVVNPEWVVPLRVGTRAVEVRGDLVWVPGPSPAPWWALAVVIMATTTAATWWSGRRRITVVVGAVGLLVILDVAHAWGIAAAVEDGAAGRSAELARVSIVSTVGWVLGALAVGLTLRGRQVGLAVAALAGGCITVGAAVAYLDNLDRSGLLFAGWDTLARITTASSLGIGVGLVIAEGARLLRQHRLI